LQVIGLFSDIIADRRIPKFSLLRNKLVADPIYHGNGHKLLGSSI